jgi:hypothetical protein
MDVGLEFPPVDLEGRRNLQPAERWRRGDADVFDPRDGAEPHGEVLNVPSRPGSGVAVLGKRGLDHKHMLVLKARVGGGRAFNRAPQQAGDDQQHAA